jgi:hypothetical protein
MAEESMPINISANMFDSMVEPVNVTGTSPLPTYPTATKIPVKDNTPFYTNFNLDLFKDKIKRPTKTIIVDQDPPPGEFVPAGTPVNVIVTVKDILPIESFVQIDTALSKYENVGALLDDLEKKDDTIASNAKAVLEKEMKYEDLTASDKQNLEGFMKNRFGEDVQYTEEKKEKLYNDMMFLYKL